MGAVEVTVEQLQLPLEYGPDVNSPRPLPQGTPRGSSEWTGESTAVGWSPADEAGLGVHPNRWETVAEIQRRLLKHYREWVEAEWLRPESEVRTVSAGQVQVTTDHPAVKGDKAVRPERYDLIPWDAMDEVAKVYAFGATKYQPHNWRLGLPWSSSYAALIRHASQFWRGEDTDEESGLSPLAHVAFHALTLIAFALEGAGHDDRPPKLHTADAP